MLIILFAFVYLLTNLNRRPDLKPRLDDLHKHGTDMSGVVEVCLFVNLTLILAKMGLWKYLLGKQDSPNIGLLHCALSYLKSITLLSAIVFPALTLFCFSFCDCYLLVMKYLNYSLYRKPFSYF